MSDDPRGELAAAYKRYIAQAEADIEKARADKAAAVKKFDHIIDRARATIAEHEKDLIALERERGSASND